MRQIIGGVVVLVLLFATVTFAQTSSAFFTKSDVKSIIISLGMIPGHPSLDTRDYYSVRFFLHSPVNDFIGFDVICESEMAAITVAEGIKRGRYNSVGHYTLSSGWYTHLSTGDVGYVINL